LLILTFLHHILNWLQWLVRELALLQNLIDRANEKGWRREYPFKMHISLIMVEILLYIGT